MIHAADGVAYSVVRVIHSDGWKGYSSLVDLGYKKHHRGIMASTAPPSASISKNVSSVTNHRRDNLY